MAFQTTFAVFAIGVLLTAGGSLGDAARRRTPLAWHAHLPWHAITFAGAAVTLFAGAHLLTLVRGPGV
jgi:hypothetical protein